MNSTTARRNFRLAAVVLGAALAWSEVSDAAICSPTISPDAFPWLRGYPTIANGNAVPIDVIPYYDTAYAKLEPASIPHEFVLRKLYDNSIVPLTEQRRFDHIVELVPQTELEPDTLYHLTLTIPGVGSVETGFTTGAARALPPSRPTAAALQNYRTPTAGSSCSPAQTGTCVVLPANQVTIGRRIDASGQAGEATYLWSDQINFSRGSFFTDVVNGDENFDFACLELRTRAENGLLSDPVTRCKADARFFDLTLFRSQPSCTSDGLFVDNWYIAPPTKPPYYQPPPVSWPECSVSSQLGARAGHAWLGLGVLFCGWLARRRLTRTRS